MNQPFSVCVQYNSLNNIIATEGERRSLLVTGVLNAALAFPTTAFNALIIVAILSKPSLLTPSYLLITSLAFTDLLQGALGQPLHSAMVQYYRKGDFHTYCYIRWISSTVMLTTVTASLTTVTVIAIDRYLAIRLKLRYKSIVTVSRVKVVLIVIWSVSMFMASLPFYIPSTSASLWGACSTGLCLVIIIVCYIMSFKALRSLCAKVQPGKVRQKSKCPSYSNSIDIEKYKRLLKTMLILLGFIVLCYSVLIIVFCFISRPSPQIISTLWGVMSILGLNSTLNPLIYISRMRDLHKACFTILRKHLSVQFGQVVSP